jgi:hypothetical protein
LAKRPRNEYTSNISLQLYDFQILSPSHPS